MTTVTNRLAAPPARSDQHNRAVPDWLAARLAMAHAARPFEKTTPDVCDPRALLYGAEYEATRGLWWSDVEPYWITGNDWGTAPEPGGSPWHLLFVVDTPAVAAGTVFQFARRLGLHCRIKAGPGGTVRLEFRPLGGFWRPRSRFGEPGPQTGFDLDDEPQRVAVRDHVATTDRLAP